MMKRKLYSVFIALLGFGIHFLYAQDSDITGGNNSIKIKYKKFELKKEQILNKTILPKTATAKHTYNTTENNENMIQAEGNLTGASTGNTTEAGSTAGGLSVSLTGTATYTIPISIPLGIKDVSPNLGINFSSQAGNGLAGWGWNLSGLSTISRISATKYYDKKQDGVDFKDDRFAIDGQRLILKSGTYGADKSVYQTENYSNIKVVAYGTSPYGTSYGPSYYIVYYPNGTRVWYGNAGNSRNRLEWAIYRWEDPQRNYVEYDYKNDNGLLSIQTIKYGSQGATNPINTIEFKYATRIRPEVVYIENQLFIRTNLLKTIVVKASGTQYRKYELDHSQTSLGYQRLTSVTEYNKDNKYLSPVRFSYKDTGEGLKKVDNTLSISPGIDYKTTSVVTGEFNGDGEMDVILYNKNEKNKVYLMTNLFSSTTETGYEVDTGNFDVVFANTMLTSDGKISQQQGVTTVTETSKLGSYKSSVRFRTFAQKYIYGPVFQYDKIWKAPMGRRGITYHQAQLSANADRRKLIPLPEKKYVTISKKYISGDFNGDGLTDVIAIDKSYQVTDYRLKYDYYKERRGRFYNGRDFESYTYNVDTRNAYFINLDRSKTANFYNYAGNLKASISNGGRLLTGDFNGDGRTRYISF